MSTWRYRVGRDEHGIYGIYEYYESGDRREIAWSKEAVAPCGESELELIQDLRAMLAAFDEGVLEVGE